MRPGVIALCAAVLPAAAACGGETSAPAWRPEGVRVVASASPTRVTVGDPIHYTLAVSVPEGMSVAPPAVVRQLGDFRVRPLGQKTERIMAGKSPPGRKAPSQEVTFLYDLRVYETGDKGIPPLKAVVVAGDGKSAEVDAGAVAVAVESVLDKDPKDIKEIKPPVSIPYFPRRLLAGLAAGLALLAAGGLLLRRLRRRRSAPTLPPRPPHEIARDELRRLRAMNLAASGRVKEYYIRLSGIVRRYIEGRFGLKAPDRTTEEFLAEAGGSGRLDPRARALVGDFLEQCDLVKFARYGPRPEEIEGAYGAAERFVDETVPRPAGGEGEGAKGGGAVR